MPKIDVNGAELYYEVDGEGPETILFGHSFLFNLRMFDEQVDLLKDRYRCVRFDFRGQGQSEITAGGYGVDELYVDALELIEKLECAPCHFIGFSMGGFVAVRVAIRRPELLRSLIMVNSSASIEVGRNLLKSSALGFFAHNFGMRMVIPFVMPTFFGKKFRKDRARADLVRKWRNYALANDRNGIYRALKGIMAREDLINQIGSINLPTLIITSDKDAALSPEKSEMMHAAIPNSRLVIIPDGGHMTPIEEPEAVNTALEEFLSGL